MRRNRRTAMRKHAIQHVLNWSDWQDDGDTMYQVAIAPDGTEYSVSIDWNASELEAVLDEDGMPVTSTPFIETDDGGSQNRAVDKMKEQAEGAWIEKSTGVRFPTDYWGQMILSSKKGKNMNYRAMRKHASVIHVPGLTRFSHDYGGKYGDGEEYAFIEDGVGMYLTHVETGPAPWGWYIDADDASVVIEDGYGYSTPRDAYDAMKSFVAEAGGNTESMVDLMLSRYASRKAKNMNYRAMRKRAMSDDMFVYDAEDNGFIVDPDFDDDDIWSMEANRRRRASRFRKAMRKSANMRKSAANSAYDIAQDVANGGPYDSEDDVWKAVKDAISDSLLYDDDIFEIAKQYIDGQELIDMFFDQFLGDVEDEVGDLSDYVRDDEEEASRHKNMSRRAMRKSTSKHRSVRHVAWNPDDIGASTRPEAIERFIVPALGDFVDDFDLDAIADEVLEYDEQDQRYYNKFQDDDDAFYDAVSRHDKTASRHRSARRQALRNRK